MQQGKPFYQMFMQFKGKAKPMLQLTLHWVLLT